MNMLMIVVVALVALCYFGGNYCPAVLKQNKKMLLGVVGGLVLCSFTGMRLEGLKNVHNGKPCELNSECTSNTCEQSECVDPKNLSEGAISGRQYCTDHMKGNCASNREMANSFCGTHGFKC
jgi:hypothetical protein